MHRVSDPDWVQGGKALTPAEADHRLHEWAVWVRTGDGADLSWPHSTAFGRMIVPDPHEPREPCDYERAAATDRVIAQLPGRLRHFLKVHYLDTDTPTIAKARRAGLKRAAYAARLFRVQVIVAYRLTPACQGGTRAQDASSPEGRTA